MKRTNENKKESKEIPNIIIAFMLIALLTLFYNTMWNHKAESIDSIVKIQRKMPFEKKIDEKENIRLIIKKDYSGLLQLVNRNNAIKKINIKDELVVPNVNLVAGEGNEKNLLRKEAAKALEEMFQAANNEKGLRLYLNSGYRSEERQTQVYKAEIYNVGEEGKGFVAKPGHSEHHTGLAADLTCKTVKFKLEQEFEETNSGKWLIENSYKYGYILRYPKGKEDETGYEYEPWHYRYVGKEISMYMNKNDLTLEKFYKSILN